MTKTTKFLSLGGGADLLSEYKDLLQSGKAYKRVDRHILFVCGGSTAELHNFRNRFLVYANDNLKSYHVLLAETAFNALLEIEDDIVQNLAHFEAAICEVSDCVIIFPESVGSYCEVGFFSHAVNVRRKTLIVNNYDFHASESFINEGPIALIDKETKFSSRIVLTNAAPNFDLIKNRLDSKLKISTRRSTFKCPDYASLSLQDKFFLFKDVIDIFGPCSMLSIEEILRGLFKSYHRADSKIILSMLNGAQYIEPHDTDSNFFSARPDRPSFIDYDEGVKQSLRLKVLEYYQSHNLFPYSLLDQREI